MLSGSVSGAVVSAVSVVITGAEVSSVAGFFGVRTRIRTIRMITRTIGTTNFKRSAGCMPLPDCREPALRFLDCWGRLPAGRLPRGGFPVVCKGVDLLGQHVVGLVCIVGTVIAVFCGFCADVVDL